MTSQLFWSLILLQMAMGAFDMIYHHELTERLAWRASQRNELALHAVRNLLYAAVFIMIGWYEMHGAWAVLLMAILGVEVVTLADFVEEDLSRALPASERITHTLLALNYGAVNATAPIPVRNADFARELGRALRRPAIMPMPAALLRSLGGFADELLLGGQRVLASKALVSGFRVRHESLRSALNAIVGSAASDAPKPYSARSNFRNRGLRQAGAASRPGSLPCGPAMSDRTTAREARGAPPPWSA